MFTFKKLARLVVPLLVATSFQALVAGDSASAPSTSKPSQGSAAKPAAKKAARPASSVAVPKSPITFSLSSTIRHGNLVVLLDGVPVFNEEFQKPLLIISQTTVWNPLQVAAGKHKLTAKVYGAKGKTYLSGIYDLEVSRTKGIELRFKTKGAKLTVEPAS